MRDWTKGYRGCLPRHRRGIAERLNHDQTLRQLWLEPLETKKLPGHLAVPVVLEHPHDWPLAAPAFLFPLCWQLGQHSPLIPVTLQTLADRVKQEMFSSRSLREHFPTASADWGLQWSESGWERVDLSSLEVSPESAFAPLAIGLASAIQNQPLARELLATGFRNSDSGRWEVRAETLKLKLAAGTEAGKTRFVVPRRDMESVRGYCRLTELPSQVVGLEDDATDLYRAVLPAVLLAGMEPGPDATRQDRLNWYLTRPTNQEAATYYQRALMGDIVSDMKQVLAAADLGQWRPDHLISIVSFSDELVLLALELFEPKTCHLVYTKGPTDLTHRYRKIEEWVDRRNKDVTRTQIALEPVPIDDSRDSLEGLVAVVSELKRGDDAGSVIIDSTPGKRVMQMAVLQGAKHGDRVLCWWHDTHQGTRRALPFSLEMLLWEVGSGRALIPLLGPTGAGATR